VGWLETHLEDFVYPTVGEQELTPHDYFTPEEHTVIKNTWRAIKKNAQGKQILLPGRDVFVWEILARRENYPTIFMPECSRQTVRHLAKARLGLRSLKNVYLFDTGFAGSIPHNLQVDNFSLLSSIKRNPDNVGTQIFPRLTFSRGLALKIEKSPKYWESGRLVNPLVGMSFDMDKEEVRQDLSNPTEFINAARLTVEVYKNSSPRFINKHKPITLRGTLLPLQLPWEA
jgi:hypothetical protein